MSELTRRGLIRNSAGVAAGVTAIGALVAQQADAEALASGGTAGAAGGQPVVAYVRNPRKGEVSVMQGDREVTVRDEKLAARIVRAAG